METDHYASYEATVEEDSDYGSITITRGGVMNAQPSNTTPAIEEGHVVLTGEAAAAHLAHHHPEVLDLFQQCVAVEQSGDVRGAVGELIIGTDHHMSGVPSETNGVVASTVPEDNTVKTHAPDFGDVLTNPGIGPKFEVLPTATEIAIEGLSPADITFCIKVVAQLETLSDAERKKSFAGLSDPAKKKLFLYLKATRGKK